MPDIPDTMDSLPPVIDHDLRMTFLPRDQVSYLQDRARSGAWSPAERRALDGIVAQADTALDLRPPSVIDKQSVPPSGDAHDYFSLSVYYWPNPDTPDGLPYVARDGYLNPEVEQFDRPPKLRMVSAVEHLVPAWLLTGDERYAAKAAELLHTWFLDPATRMNPHMLFAQHIPGTTDVKGPPNCPPRWVEGVDGRGVYVSYGGVIEGCTLALALDTADLLAGCSAWTPEDDTALRSWAGDFVHWLRTHQHGRDEAMAPNNHALWYQVQAARYLLFAGRTNAARMLLDDNATLLVYRDIDPSGRMPAEVNRAIGLHYVTFSLTAFCNMALMCERVGLDLWHYVAADGKSLRAAIDWALPYWQGAPWPYKPPAKPFGYHLCIPILGLAARAYQDRKYLEAARNVPGVPEDHPFRLLYLGEDQ